MDKGEKERLASEMFDEPLEEVTLLLKARRDGWKYRMSRDILDDPDLRLRTNALILVFVADLDLLTKVSDLLSEDLLKRREAENKAKEEEKKDAD